MTWLIKNNTKMRMIKRTVILFWSQMTLTKRQHDHFSHLIFEKMSESVKYDFTLRRSKIELL